jgi:hypothetical protein
VDIPDQPKPPQGGTPLQRIGHVPVEVRSANVEGIVAVTSPGSSVTGRIRVEGQTDWTRAFLSISNRHYASIQPSSNGVRPLMPGVPQPTNSLINPEGTFRIDNVMPGEYRLEIGSLRPAFYVKEARFAGVDILARRFKYSGNVRGSLEILLSGSVGSVEGILTNNQMSAATGVQVVLVPEKMRHRIELFKSAVTDQNGRFNVPNVAPGDYKVYAWEAVELYRWFDPDFLKDFEQFSVPVHVAESSRQTVNARVIPSASR